MAIGNIRGKHTLRSSVNHKSAGTARFVFVLSTRTDQHESI